MFSNSLNSNSDIVIVMIVAVKLTQSSRDSVSRQLAKRTETRSARRYFHCLRRTNPLLRSRRFINQYFRFTEQKSPRIQLNNNTNRNCLLGASSCASRRKVPRCVSDVRIEVSCRRDLNTDVSVLVCLIDKSSDSDSHHAGVSL